MYNGPRIPKNGLKYIWDFSNPKGINNIEGAFGNEIFTKTNLEPSNGAIIHSGSTANDNYLEVDGTNDECPTGIDVSWNNTNNCSWAFWFLADSTQYLGGILGKKMLYGNGLFGNNQQPLLDWYTGIHLEVILMEWILE